MNKKKLCDLTTDDLAENPIWEYSIAENIEYVRASEKTEVTPSPNTIYIVATDFTLKNKTNLLGFCSPSESSSISHLQPVILTKKGHVELYKDTDWTNQETVRALKKVGYEKPDVFPIVYKTLVKCKHNIQQGILLNFNLETKQTQ